jgi:Leucine-rich repeat (LRR) protein
MIAVMACTLPLVTACGESTQTPPEPAAKVEKAAEPAVTAPAEPKPDPLPEVPAEVRQKCAVFEPPWGEQWWVDWGQENPEKGEEWLETAEEKMAAADLSILPECKHLERLFLGFLEITDLTPLSGLTRLKYLDLRFDTKLEDLSPLEQLKNLEHLVITGTGVKSFEALGRIKSLQELEARQLAVTDISPLAGLPELWRVDFLKNPISDVTALARAPKVNKLRLCQTDIESYDDLLPVAKRIRELETCASKIKVENFPQLAAFENLVFLRLWGNPIEDLSPLSGMSQLEELDLTQTKVRDLTPLHGLKKLKKLWLMMLDIEDAQIEALQKALPDLEIVRKMQFN